MFLFFAAAGGGWAGHGYGPVAPLGAVPVVVGLSGVEGPGSRWHGLVVRIVEGVHGGGAERGGAR